MEGGEVDGEWGVFFYIEGGGMGRWPIQNKNHVSCFSFFNHLLKAK